MHRILARQLRKLNLSEASPPDLDAWRALLSRVDATYEQEDKTHYLLERSLRLTSDEMRELNQRLRNSYESRQRAILQALPDLLFVLDDAGRFIDVMASNEELLAMPIDSFLRQRASWASSTRRSIRARCRSSNTTCRPPGA